MEIENNKEQVPFSYYADLFQAVQPEEVTQRLKDVRWDGKAFFVKLLGQEFAIEHPVYAISALGGGKEPKLPVQTFLLRYLLEGRTIPFDNQWKTFREMPWGELYIKPYTGRVLTRAAFSLGTRIKDFRAAAEKMGAEPLPHGDAGYCFNLIGDYQMQLLVWEGDEEFPPNAQVLYSGNFEQGFAPEDRVVAGDILISAIREWM